MDRAEQHERLFNVILRTRDPNGTWNDRVLERSRAYGTAMTVLALLEDKVSQAAALPDVVATKRLISVIEIH